MSQQKENSGAQAQMVNFGRGILINPAKRLPVFDNGSSLAYEAKDTQGNVLIAIVCDPVMVPRLGQIAGYDLLVDLSLIRLVVHGVCLWTPLGQERYVLFYRCPCNSSLLNDQGFLKPQWRFNDLMNYFIRPMIGSLNDLKERGFYHGSIRPDNIFYQTTNPSQPVVLGDCLSVQPSSTQLALFEPYERAMAHPMARGIGANSDDIYAFGVTLATLLRTQDVLTGLPDDEIIRRKIENGSYFAIIGRERFNANVLTLLRGVLHDDPKTRWGMPEILSWVDGGKVNAPQPISRKKAARALNFMDKKYVYASALAFDLHRNPKEVSALVESEVLPQWIEKGLGDKEMAENYALAMERVAKYGRNDLDYLICNLRIVLAPQFALMYRDLVFTINGVGGMLAHSMFLKKDVSNIKAVLSSGICVTAMSISEMPQGVAMNIIKKFDACRGALRQTRMGFGIEYCIHALSDDAPCFSPAMKNMFVYGKRGLLEAFEKLSAQSGQTPFFLDQYSMGMLAVQDPAVFDAGAYELNSPEKEKKMMGNLKCLAMLCQRIGNSGGDQQYPALCNVFLGSVDVIYKMYHNRNLRKKMETTVIAAAKKGDLVTMADALCDYAVMEHDQAGFRRAKAECAKLLSEKDGLLRGMARKHSFGTNKGHDVAAIVAWLIAGVVMILMVLVFLSGGTIF